MAYGQTIEQLLLERTYMDIADILCSNLMRNPNRSFMIPFEDGVFVSQYNTNILIFFTVDRFNIIRSAEAVIYIPENATDPQTLNMTVTALTGLTIFTGVSPRPVDNGFLFVTELINIGLVNHSDAPPSVTSDGRLQLRYSRISIVAYL